MKHLYKKIFPVSMIKYLKKELKGCENVLDLGCGNNSPLGLINFKGWKVGVEAYSLYVKESKLNKIHDIYLTGDVLNLTFANNTFDCIIALDLIEHLNKEDGLMLLRRMEKWAKKKVIIYTPNGFVKQITIDDNKLQNHLSGWEVADFEDRGYNVRGINGLKCLRTGRANIKFKPKHFWRVISDLTQKATYYNPYLAFQLFAVKEVKK